MKRRPAHRHNASVFVYVLEGAVVMQVKGGKEVTLGPGQTFYESPGRRARGFPECQHYKACQVPGVLCEAERDSTYRAGKVIGWRTPGSAAGEAYRGPDDDFSRGLRLLAHSSEFVSRRELPCT